MEGLFGMIVGLFVLISIISGISNAASGNKKGGKPTSSLKENVLRAMELELEEKDARKNTAAGTAAQTGKPIHPHSTDDCTGGSIHDGYHEGTIRRPAPASSAEGKMGAQGARRTSYAAGRTGQGMQGSEGAGAGRISGLPSREELLREVQSKLAYEKASASHAAGGVQQQPAPKPASTVPQKSGLEKLTETISSKPPMVQGIMWAEILGRPLSDS